MSVTPIHTFTWSKDGCVSHDRARVKWPQTQDLDVLYAVNSAIFMINRAAMRSRIDRIGDAPYLLTTTMPNDFDIDWPADFEFGAKVAGFMLDRDGNM
jgi:N-acylneuraminate cytidylyltransferase